MKCKRAYLHEPHHFEIEERELDFGPRQVLVKVKLCGLCNWERHFWNGAGEEGGYYRTYSHVLGHEWAGVVEAVGAEVTDIKVGDKVTYLPKYAEFGGFSEYAVPYEDECVKLSPEANLYNAMGEPLKCIITVINNAAPCVGDNGVILGCGPMGLWCVQALKSQTLASLIAVDIDDDKLALAKKYGATHLLNPKRDDVPARIREITGGRLADFVIEGTGNVNLIPVTFDYLETKGRLVLMSTYARALDNLDLSPVIDKCLKIYAAHPSSSYDQTDDIRRAIALVNNGTFNNDDIITHRFKLEEINLAFETLENRPSDYIKGIIEF